MQVFPLKFTAGYSSYRRWFRDKRSTTIFIPLEARWAGRREGSTFRASSQTEAWN